MLIWKAHALWYFSWWALVKCVSETWEACRQGHKHIICLILCMNILDKLSKLSADDQFRGVASQNILEYWLVYYNQFPIIPRKVIIGYLNDVATSPVSNKNKLSLIHLYSMELNCRHINIHYVPCSNQWLSIFFNLSIKLTRQFPNGSTIVQACAIRMMST